VTDPAAPNEPLGSPHLSDSERYHGDSEGYHKEEHPHGPSPEHADEDGDAGWLMEGPAWERDDFADDWMPDRALGEAAGGVDGLEPSRREWQVNIRLDRERYAALKRAADLYGTSPTALARMLLNRGSQAILNAHRAEMATFECGNPRR
jgi:hypothetical protein